MMDRDTRIFYLAAFVALVLLAISFALPVICEGQTLDTSGWQTAEYSLAQCGPSGCPTGGFLQGRPIVPGMNPSYGGNIQRPPIRQQPQRSSGVKRIASVVFIKSSITTNVMAGETSSKLGSGTYIGNGYVITCGHILRDGWKPVVYFANTGLPDKPFPATIIAADASIDLGLLRITPLKNDADYAMILAPSNPRIGETVWWAGFGQGSFSAGPGRVTQYVGSEIKINATVRQGDSGGPLFTSAGLVGVISEGEVNVDIGGACVEYIRQWIASVRGDGVQQGSTVPLPPEANGERPSTSVEGSPITVESPAMGNGPIPPVASGGSTQPCTQSPNGRPDVCGCGRPFATEEEIAEWRQKPHPRPPIHVWDDVLRNGKTILEAYPSLIVPGPATYTPVYPPGDIKQQVSQEVSQAVTVQMQGIGQQLIDKELVPLRDRVTQLELQQQAFSVALAGCVSGSGQKGEKGERGEQGPQGEQGPPGKDAVVDYDAIVGLVLDRLPKQPQATDGLYADLVYDSDGDYWAWMRPEAEQAKAQFSLRLVEAPEGHDFGTLPQLVFYRSGTPIKRVAGSSDVWQMLSMIRGGKDLVLKE